MIIGKSCEFLADIAVAISLRCVFRACAPQKFLMAAEWLGISQVFNLSHSADHHYLFQVKDFFGKPRHVTDGSL
jgi:hypothetical protein